MLIAHSALFGLVYMFPILFTLGSLETILASATGQPVPEMFLQATGSQGAAFGLFFVGKPDTGLVMFPMAPRELIVSACEWSGVWSGMLSSRIQMHLGVSHDSVSFTSLLRSPRPHLLTLQLFPGRRSSRSQMARTCLSASSDAS